MCGIVAYIGKKQAYPVILKGLKRLEYRGYDSAGIALLNEGEINLYKRQGKVSNLEEYACCVQHRRTFRNWAYALGNSRCTK
jgi:glutamine---fructose-6-phosphate transaminase (isomerizing)